ncbi:uncharacterized protein LOC131944859 [Physella acuta]|uniref:uncharacterized protein LOC131944859 n=1 Tax=Physella acuta TaxID=109671 RepID=UPI0027DAF3F8|nr:uncharacterized protein LOC131944859 [Physella acuta]
MPMKPLSSWEKVFRSADVNGDGTLDFGELRLMLRREKSNLTDSQIMQVFKFFDGPNGDRKITLTEFISGMRKIEQFVESLKALFNKFDTDRSGYLERDEMRRLLNSCGQRYSTSDVDHVIRLADANGDGKISLEELIYACT